MSEYWVSQAKFYCKFCNVWIADNKPTRQLHDGGAKHKFNVDEFHKKKRNEKLFGARSEGEIRQQLAEIERAAKEAVAADRLEETGLFYSKPVTVGPGPPPPPPRPSSGSNEEKGGNYSDNRRRQDVNVTEKEEEKIEENNSGTYTVDGQTYLEGPLYENLFTRSMNCEVFIEDADEWYAAVILGRKDVAVPHTEIFLRTFEVSYITVIDLKKEIKEIDQVDNVNEEDEEKQEIINQSEIDLDMKGTIGEVIYKANVIKSKCQEDNNNQAEDVVGMDEDIIRSPPTIITLPITSERSTAGDDPNVENVPISVKKARTSRWDSISTPLPPQFQPSLATATSVFVLEPPPPLPSLSSPSSIPPPPSLSSSSSIPHPPPPQPPSSLSSSSIPPPPQPPSLSSSSIPPPPPPQPPSSLSSSSIPPPPQPPSSLSSSSIPPRPPPLSSSSTLPPPSPPSAQSAAESELRVGAVISDRSKKNNNIRIENRIELMECEYGAEVYSNHDHCVTDVENKQDHRNQSSNEDEEEPLLETVVVSGIRSDHLRLLCDEEGNVIGPNGEIVFQVAALARIPVPVSVDQSTGYSAWQTVSVHTIDEEEEALYKEEEAIRFRESVRNQALGITAKKEEIDPIDKDVQEEDVMSTFDPYGTSMYKGMRVGDGESHRELQTMTKKGEKVGFKKRKKMGTSVVTGSSSSSSSSSNDNVHINGDSSCSITGNDNHRHLKEENSDQVNCTASINTVQIKIEKDYLLSSFPPEREDVYPFQNACIKTEIKLEPKTEPSISPVKMSFGFNTSKKLRKT